MEIIKFGISKNYVPDWKVTQAIREIYQNFIDYGEFDVKIDKVSETTSSVMLSNNFDPKNLEFLKIGFSKKANGSIGKHGEGLKLAGLIFLRNDNPFTVYTKYFKITPSFYDEDNIGECYGMEYDDFDGEKFHVYFEADNKALGAFNGGRIMYKEDVLHTSSYGDIVNKPKGNIYVGGLYVCHFKSLKYAFDFKPEYVSLGRDRDFPSTTDIEFYSNRIINSCQDKLTFRASEITNREFNTGDIPEKLANKFSPVISETGKVQLKSGNTIVTDSGMVSRLLQIPKIAKKLEKLRSFKSSKSRKSPHTLIVELKGQLCLTDVEEIKFDSILKMAKKWRVK